MAEFGVDWFQIDFFTKQLRQAFFSSVKCCEGCHLIYCIAQNYFTYLGKSSICNRMLRCVKTHYSRIFGVMAEPSKFGAIRNSG